MSKIDDVRIYTENICKRMGVQVSRVEVVTDHELDVTVINIESPEKGLFEYNNGELVWAMNHLVRRAMEQSVRLQEGSFDNLPNYILDVNNKQTKHVGELKSLAREAIRQAKKTGHTINLPAMNAYDRLMVHTFLAKQAGVASNSVGEGWDRHITISKVSK